MKITVTFNVSNAKQGLQDLRQAMMRAIETGVSFAARVLLRDTRPYIPLLTGKLRDSGHIEQLKDYAFKLVWDAANPVNDYVYAQKQYEDILQHVDGRYAAEWVKKTLENNQGRYIYLASRYMAVELHRLLGGQ